MLPGVYLAAKKDGTPYYRASIHFQNKHISLGSFPAEEDANRAYLNASKLLTDSSIDILNVFFRILFSLMTSSLSF